MGIGNAIWQLEAIKRTSVWAMDNIKLDIRGIAKGILDFVQDREGDGTFEIC